MLQITNYEFGITDIGCCITKSVYVRDVNRVLVLYSAITTVYGDCSPLAPNNPPKWPRWGDCDPLGSLIGDCEINCQ